MLFMKVFQLKNLSLLAVACIALFVQSCRDFQPATVVPTADQFDSQVYHEWSQTFLRIERYAKGYRPGPAPRALGYLGLAAYECAIPGMPNNNSMAAMYPQLSLPTLAANTEIHYPAAINASYALLMERFFFHMENEYPDLFNSIQQKHLQLHAQYANETSTEVLERSEQWGRDVAAAIYSWEQTDTKGHNAFLNPQPADYNPPTGPGYWYNLSGARGMFPFWGQVRTFAIDETDKLARKPIPYSENPNSLFYDQAEEVYKTVKFVRENPSDPLAYEQKWIGEFWSDDLLNLTFSPPARLLAVADQIALAERIDLAAAAELFAKLGMALHDNGVAIWHSKYAYNLERPDTYIRRVLSAQYPDAANWVSNLNNPLTGVQGITPAFPAYPSGHSGFGGAGSKILTSIFEFTPRHPGTYTFTDQCHLGRSEFLGIPRTYRSIAESGEENAYSRIPLGVHYRMDCDEGLRLGELAAQRVLELPWKK
jgi:hypothetical protein